MVLKGPWTSTSCFFHLQLVFAPIGKPCHRHETQSEKSVASWEWFCSLRFYVTTSSIIVTIVLGTKNWIQKMFLGKKTLKGPSSYYILVHRAKGPDFRGTLRNVVGMAGDSSLYSGSLDQDPIMTARGRIPYWTCRTRTTHLAELHGEIARKTLQRNCGHGTLADAIAEGMYEGLVQLVQSVNLQKLLWYLLGHIVNCVKLQLHPSIKQRHLWKTVFPSCQGGSWHCLNTSVTGWKVQRSHLG